MSDYMKEMERLVSDLIDAAHGTVMTEDQEREDTARAALLTHAATGSAEFLAGGARYKISGGSIRGLPRELDGRWVALVAADDDCHS